MILIGAMKIPICSMCDTPLIKKNSYLAFKCMCDDEVRIIPLEFDWKECSHIKYLSIIDVTTEYEQHSKQSNCAEIKSALEPGGCSISVENTS